MLASAPLVICLAACSSGRSDPPVKSSARGATTHGVLPVAAKTAAGTVIGPWNATVINHLSLAWTKVVSADGALFGLSRRDSELIRIDPVTGLVVDHVPVSGEPLPPIVVNSTIWLASESSVQGTVTVQWFDLATLARRGSTSVSFAGATNAGPELAADQTGNRVYLGAGDSVAVLDATTGRIQKRLPVDGQVLSLAVAPDGGRLYVDSATNADATLRILDATSGVTITTIRAVQVSDADTGIVAATTGGLWLSMAGGHTQSLMFVPMADLARGRITHAVHEGTGGGGPYASVTFARGVAWIGGPYTIACANPDTGTIYTHANTGDTHATTVLTSITYVGNTAYAAYENDNGSAAVTAVVRLSPPAACFER
jgi:hypothetical protein